MHFPFITFITISAPRKLFSLMKTVLFFCGLLYDSVSFPG